MRRASAQLFLDRKKLLYLTSSPDLGGSGCEEVDGAGDWATVDDEGGAVVDGGGPGRVFGRAS